MSFTVPHGAAPPRSAPRQSPGSRRPSICWNGVFAAAAAALAALLTGCANAPPAPAPSPPQPVQRERQPAPESAPDTAPEAERDGPEASPPPDLAERPDAQPVLEPIRVGGPNKPYEALGQRYVPITADLPFSERGLASWYGRKFQGRRTSSGERYDMYAMTAAHPTLPIPSYARVRNVANGREVIVRINDRGPFHSTRIIDLSYTAALKLDVLRGTKLVEVQRITGGEIRSGRWKQGAGATEPTPVPASADAPLAPPTEPAAPSPSP